MMLASFWLEKLSGAPMRLWRPLPKGARYKNYNGEALYFGSLFMKNGSFEFHGARFLSNDACVAYTYRQDRPDDWLRENAEQAWRCDVIIKRDEMCVADHHAVAGTPAEAFLAAVLRYFCMLEKGT